MFSERKILERLDRMLEDGISGTFEESDYDESQLSKLESRWLRYLTSSKLSARRTEEEREKLKELVSDISHQTKTPLANLLLYSQLLEERDLDDETRRLVTEIQVQTEKLEFLIKSLVKVSRLETGIIGLSPARGDLGSVITAAAEQALPMAEGKQITIQYSPDMATAVFDSKWTQEALFNIVDNAVKYSPERSVINLSVNEFELFTCVSVADQGKGISEEDLPKIFGRFYRGENAGDQSGVGLGLYLARQIIEGQGGYITVESEPEPGTVFHIYLPK